MAAEYSSNLTQEVAANAAVIFTESPVPCNRGLVFHRNETGVFLLASTICCNRGRCCCGQWIMPSTVYAVDFHANIQVPTGGTVGPISLALVVDGEIDPSSIMTVTPAAVEEPFNVGASILVSVPAICGCSKVSVRNIGTDPVEVLNSNIVFDLSSVRR